VLRQRRPILDAEKSGALMFCYGRGRRKSDCAVRAAAVADTCNLPAEPAEWKIIGRSEAVLAVAAKWPGL